VIVKAADIERWISSLTTVIPPGFFDAMAVRESNRSTTSTLAEGNGQISKGLWQVNDGEAASVGVHGDLYDPLVCATAIVGLMNRNLDALVAKYGLDAGGTGVLPNDVWYYLAASHNAGLSRVEGWLDEQGGVVDWSLTKENHPTFVTIARGYADDIGDAAQPGLLAGVDKVDVTLIIVAIGAALWLAMS
jgi:hypothetical protein